MPSATTADGYALALEEARRALDEQERAVAQLSSGAGTLLAAAAIATSFLGGQALSRDEIGVASWIAIAAFVAFCGAASALLVPPRGWTSATSPTSVMRMFRDPRDAASSQLARRDLALHMEAAMRRNARHLRRTLTVFHVATVLLTIEILAWVVALATTG